MAKPKTETYYRLKVDAYKAGYSNPGQFKPGALYTGESTFYYSDSRKPLSIKELAEDNQPDEWEKVEIIILSVSDVTPF